MTKYILGLLTMSFMNFALNAHASDILTGPPAETMLQILEKRPDRLNTPEFQAYQRRLLRKGFSLEAEETQIEISPSPVDDGQTANPFFTFIIRQTYKETLPATGALPRFVILSRMGDFYQHCPQGPASCQLQDDTIQWQNFQIRWEFRPPPPGGSSSSAGGRD